VRVEREHREDLREQTEGALDVGLVLGSRERRADAESVTDGSVYLGRVVGGAVVEQERERGRAGGDDAAVEGINDGGDVFLVAHGGADEGSRVGIDIELEVEDEALLVDDDRDLHAITDPLCAGEEGLERASQRELIGATPVATNDGALGVNIQDAAHEVEAKGDE
jgi:hypothetical protein